MAKCFKILILSQSLDFEQTASPHKLRHTGATLAKQAGTSIETISEALTHSDTITTKTYVNTSNVIPMAVGEIAYRNLKK